jgi:hypothetical protein
MIREVRQKLKDELIRLSEEWSVWMAKNRRSSESSDSVVVFSD